MNEKATTTKRQATKLVEVVMLTNIPIDGWLQYEKLRSLSDARYSKAAGRQCQGPTQGGCCLPSLSSRYSTEIKWRGGNGL